ncbi:MAG TPA: hypothetical protein VGP99_08715 [Tepidisphaeraceae bacterium]|jgi:hypothetical protein|nr:hypothetical protein [Tepidisphaeraceae bacterium]
MKRNHLYIGIPVLFCVAVLFVVRPWKSHAEPGKPGEVASTAKQGKQLLVVDRAPAGSQVNYEYIMPEDQQRRIIKEGSKLKVGDDLNSVLDRLGSPLKDNVSYGKKDPSEPQHGRALSYYFAKRLVSGANDFDPLVFIVFDEKGKLFAITSNVSEVPELNWGAGITAQFGIVH